MAVKVYAKGNYFIIEREDGTFKEDHKINVRVAKRLISDTNYLINMKGGSELYALADLTDENGTAYTKNSWETFAFSNSGFSSASGGSGAGTTISVVANYSALPSATSHSTEFYWVSDEQGTKWLPGSLGGTYYPNGMYYSNGTDWEYLITPYNATLSEVDTGTNTDKFITPSTFTNASKWATKVPYTGATTSVDLGAYNLTATQLIKLGGISTEFLKADGSIDSNTYLTSADLPSSLDLFATTTVSDVATYYVLVKNISDIRYNSTAVDVPTGTITTTNQLIASLVTDANILSGELGIFNFTTVGNIARISGTGEAEFYFRIYKRASNGTETFITQSSNTIPVTNGGYSEFSAVALWNDGIFSTTDRIVVKYYANRLTNPTGSDPSYNFQFGGIAPVRSFAPVPTSVIPTIDTTTTLNITDSTDKRFVTDDNLTTIGNTTNTNSGDETNGTIKTKLGVANGSNDGYLSSSDYTTFASAGSPFIPQLPITSYPQGYYANNGSATLSILGNVSSAALSGTASLNSIVGTNTLTRTVRISIPTSSTVGSKAGVRTASLRHSVGQGFLFSVCWMIQDASYVAGAKQFHGLLPISTLSTISNLINVESLMNFVGVGSDATDLNLQIFHSANGTTSKIDLGADFPANRTAGAVMNNVYVFEMYNEPNTTTVKYRITERSSGLTTQGEITTNLPDATVLLASQSIRTNGATALATITQWQHLIGYIL
jgi:hypothetical protein